MRAKNEPTEVPIIFLINLRMDKSSIALIDPIYERPRKAPPDKAKLEKDIIIIISNILNKGKEYVKGLFKKDNNNIKWNMMKRL